MNGARNPAQIAPWKGSSRSLTAQVNAVAASDLVGNGETRGCLALRTTTHRLLQSDGFGEGAHAGSICNIRDGAGQVKRAAKS